MGNQKNKLREKKVKKICGKKMFFKKANSGGSIRR
jgi:hypothetical protein